MRRRGIGGWVGGDRVEVLGEGGIGCERERKMAKRGGEEDKLLGRLLVVTIIKIRNAGKFPHFIIIKFKIISDDIVITNKILCHR